MHLKGGLQLTGSVGHLLALGSGWLKTEFDGS